MEIGTTNIIIFYLLQTASVICGAFLFAYLRKRGSNWADRKDLPEMTQTVESIKAGHSIASDKKMQLFKEEKDELILYGANLTKFLFKSIKIDITEFDIKREAQLAELIDKMEEVHDSLIYSSTKLYMLALNQEVISAVTSVQETATKWFNLLDSAVSEQLWSMKFTLREEKEEYFNKTDFEKQVFWDFQAISLNSSAEKLQEKLTEAFNSEIHELSVSIAKLNLTVNKYFNN